MTTNPDRKSGRSVRLMATVAEATLFAVALFLLIPPVPSEGSAVRLKLGSVFVSALLYLLAKVASFLFLNESAGRAILSLLIFSVFVSALAMRFSL